MQRRSAPWRPRHSCRSGLCCAKPCAKLAHALPYPSCVLLRFRSESSSALEDVGEVPKLPAIDEDLGAVRAFAVPDGNHLTAERPLDAVVSRLITARRLSPACLAQLQIPSIILLISARVSADIERLCLQVGHGLVGQRPAGLAAPKVVLGPLVTTSETLKHVGELSKFTVTEDELGTVGILAVTDSDYAGDLCKLNAVRSVFFAARRLTPHDSTQVHLSSITFLIRARVSRTFSASPCNTTNVSFTKATCLGLVVVSPPYALSV